MHDGSGPVVSVVLPVYNGASYLGDAMDSILAQTYESFELIVIDDGSTDATPKVLRQYKDDRIRILIQENRGLAATLNRGVELARGKYIARQDSDDLSLPDRFARQVDYLERHPNCALLGTWAAIWRDRVSTERIHRHPTDNPTLQFELLFDNPFVHSSVMIRKDALDVVGLYTTDPARQPPEDYELWSRIARYFEVGNLPHVLQIYREIPGSITRTNSSHFLEKMLKISAENIAEITGVPIEDPALQSIVLLTHQAVDGLQESPDFDAIKKLLRRAASEIANPQSIPSFRKRADQRLRRLRSIYLQYRYKDNWLKYLWFKAVYRGKEVLFSW